MINQKSTNTFMCPVCVIQECVGCLEKSDFVTTILKVKAELPAPKAEL